jgi:glycosyltransferase involved in cell wall biosynthesis
MLDLTPRHPGATARLSSSGVVRRLSPGVGREPLHLPTTDAAPGKHLVVHLVGRLTDQVFSFLRPATEAIAQTGADQCVVLLDDPRNVQFQPEFDTRVRLVPTPNERSMVRRWQAAHAVYQQVLGEHAPTAVHLHGFVPWLLGAGLARRANPDVRVFYSPYGSALRGSIKAVSTPLLWAVRRWQGHFANQTIVCLDSQERNAPVFKVAGVELIESPVSRVFLETPRNPARRALIVTSSNTQRPGFAFRFAQLAVLLGDASIGLAFNWIGTADRESLAALKAANVGVFNVTNEEDRAQRLASGWVYLAIGSAPGFPWYLVEAMAMGLPCIALDTPCHRAVMRHRETGFLCRTDVQIRQILAELIDSPELRASIGSAARDDASQRFDERRFRDSVLSAYALPAP